MLYDFNASVGDSISLCETCNVVVSSIDSVFIDGNYRKRFNISGLQPYSVIEGIGSTFGILEPTCHFEYSGELTCHSQNGHTIYPDSSVQCSIITNSGSSVQKEQQISLYPNPFSESTNLEITLSDPFWRWEIFDSFGRLTQSISGTSGTKTKIKRDGISSGIYFFRITSDSNKQFHGKLTVE